MSIKKRFLGLLLVLAAGLPAIDARAEPITLTAADGVKVYAELWRAPGERTPLVLAFHQAQSNHAEYEPIAKRLNQEGFSVLAIDQRSGGDYFGGVNRTVAGIGASTSYEGAFKDMEAALLWGEEHTHGAPILLWGSSYSAALVFLLAAQEQGAIDGIVAFSPDEYLPKRRAVRDAAAKVVVPVFITQSTTRGEYERAHRIFRALRSEVKENFVPARRGEHGASTLRADTNPEGAEENWQAVLKFIARFRKP